MPVINPGSGSGSGSSAPNIVNGGSLGAAKTVTMSATTEQWLYGTLTANLTVTLASLVAGARARLFLTQNGTGNWTLSIFDGTSTQLVTIDATASASSEVDIYSPDGTLIFIERVSPLGAVNPNTPQYGLVASNMTALTASTTLVDIPALVVPIGASNTETWLVKYRVLFVGANHTMNSKWGFTFPTGCTAEGGPDGTGAGVTLMGYGAPLISVTPTLSMLLQTSVLTVGTGVSVRQGLALLMVVSGGGTAGNFQIQYAQNTSDAGTLQILKGSTVEYVRIAT